MDAKRGKRKKEGIQKGVIAQRGLQRRGGRRKGWCGMRVRSNLSFPRGDEINEESGDCGQIGTFPNRCGVRMLAEVFTSVESSSIEETAMEIQRAE